MTYLKIFTTFLEDSSELSDEEMGRLFRAMLNYAQESQDIKLVGNEKFMWKSVKRLIDNEKVIYEKKVDTARKNSSVWKNDTTDIGNKKPISTEIDFLEPISTDIGFEKPISVQEKEKEKDKEYILPPKGGVGENQKTESHEKKKFGKPNVEEVAAYCSERNNGIDPEEFWNFYESKGWKVGNTPMKNWKSAIVTWEKNRRKAREPCETTVSYREEWC